jgi:hypothetical protein
MANIPLADAVTIRDETIPNANTATRVGNFLVAVANFINLGQIPDPIITEAVAADVDDWSPVGFATANMIRADVSGGNQQITGMVAPPAGQNRIVTITNVSLTGDQFQFQDNDAGSLAANRFLLRDNNNRNMRPNEGAQFWYDHTSARWRQMTQVG